MSPLLRPLRVALVLGGGGARGLAHVGALAALEEGGFRPDFIVGTSAGAIVGGAYAARPVASDLRKQAMRLVAHGPLQLLERRFKALTEPVEHGFGARVRDRIRQAKKLLLYHRQAMKQALVTNRILDRLAQGMVGSVDFADLAIPFYAVACDLVANQRVVLGNGSVAAAVAASGAIPGVFEPVPDADRLLVDGCVLDVLPCEVARALGADLLIAVDIGHAPELGAPRHAAGIQKRVADLRSENLRQRNRALADLLIEPNVGGIEWMEVSQSELAYQAGYAAARARLPALEHTLHRVCRQTLFGRLFRPTPVPTVPITGIAAREPVPMVEAEPA